MKKFRQRFLKMKEGFLDAKTETSQQAFTFANKVLISIIYLVVCFSSMIFIAFDLAIITYVVITIAVLVLAAFTFSNKLFNKTMPLSSELLMYFFGKYGRVVTKEDWKNIKKQDYKLYRVLRCNKSLGSCYYYSREIALYLKDAKLMYCIIDGEDGPTAHAVIVKNNCVYCTNGRAHFDLEEYKQYLNVKVYKMFSEKEYRSETFFDDIRDNFMEWCSRHNAYCDPQ